MFAQKLLDLPFLRVDLSHPHLHAATRTQERVGPEDFQLHRKVWVPFSFCPDLIVVFIYFSGLGWNHCFFIVHEVKIPIIWA